MKYTEQGLSSDLILNPSYSALPGLVLLKFTVDKQLLEEDPKKVRHNAFEE